MRLIKNIFYVPLNSAAYFFNGIFTFLFFDFLISDLPYTSCYPFFLTFLSMMLFFLALSLDSFRFFPFFCYSPINHSIDSIPQGSYTIIYNTLTQLLNHPIIISNIWRLLLSTYTIYISPSIHLRSEFAYIFFQHFLNNLLNKY